MSVKSISYAACIFLVTVPSALAEVWFVDRSNQSGTQDGLSWATAFTEIQPALDAAFAAGNKGVAANHQVWVAAGVYDEERDNDTGSIDVPDNVDLLGGFSGTESDVSQRDPSMHPTIIDGSVARAGDNAAPTLMAGNHLRISGFTFTGGGCERCSGGAIRVDDLFAEGIVIDQCIFHDNDGVGAIWVAGEVRVEGCQFHGNSGAFGGGAFAHGAFSSSNVVFRDCEFFQNETLSLEDTGAGLNIQPGLNGEAMFRLENCVFYQNGGPGAGHAIAVVAPGGTFQGSVHVDIVNCTIAENQPSDSSGLYIEVAEDYEGEVTVSTLNSIIRNSILSDVPLDIRFSNILGGHAGEGNIDIQSQFADSVSGDFRLTINSPEIDLASTPLAPEMDILGVVRPQGPAADMGAYEFNVSGDSDGDGLADGSEQPDDTDGDGIDDILDPDSDNDGIIDGDEVALGLDHTDPDSDGDGMEDGWEVDNGLDPFVDDSDDDEDNDGVPNGLEFELDGDPNGPLSPSHFFVSTSGDDEDGDGTEGNPWATIARAMGDASINAEALFDFSQATIHLAAGLYEENVTMAPFVALVGDDVDSTTVQSSGIVVESAEGAFISDLELALPPLLAEVSVLLRVDDVTTNVTNLRFEGSDNLNSIGLLIGGVNSSDSVISDSIFRRVDFGIQAVDTSATFTENTFDGIRTDAVFVRLPDAKGRKGNALTPNLGDITIPDSGFNTFNFVGGAFVFNSSSNVTMAENNDWGLTDAAAIAAKMVGPVDFEPFTGQVLEGTGEGSGEGMAEGAGEGDGEGAPEGAGEPEKWPGCAASRTSSKTTPDPYGDVVLILVTFGIVCWTAQRRTIART